MPDGLNPIVKRYLKGTVESRGKELTWETDDHGFLFVIDRKYYEVPYKEFIYEGPDQFIQLTHDAVIDRSIVGIFRTIAVYCTELLLHPETFAYYDSRLVTGHLGKLLSGEITTGKGKYKWRVTSESVEVDSKPRVSMMYVSHKYYTSEIWTLLAPEVPYNVCQMFVIIGNLYIRCTKFNEPEVVLSLKDIQYNIQMRKEAERRQREMEEQRKAEERRRKEASAQKYGGGVDIGLGSGGSLYHDEFLNTSETAKAVASSGGVSLSKFGEEEPEFEQIPINDTVSSPKEKQETQAKQGIELQKEQLQPEVEIQAQQEAELQQEQLQPEAEIQTQETELQKEQLQPEVEVQIQQEAELQQEQPEIEEQTQEQMVQQEETEAAEEQKETDTSYMDAVMQYLEEMDLPTKNPERSIKKYYPEWALEPIKDLTGDAFLKEFAKML